MRREAARRSTALRTLVLLAVALLLPGLQTSCADSAPRAPTVIAEAEPELDFSHPEREPLLPSGPVLLPFPAPAKGGSAYRIVLELSGEWFITTPGDPADKPPLSESHLLELEYREFPTERTGDGRDAYLLGLDALHYKLFQKNPPALREIEVGSDRLRVHADGKEQMDLRGAQPKGDLTPQKVLGRIFGVLVHDGFGNPLALAPRGVPVVRDFLEALYLKEAVGYSRFAWPSGEISPGATWQARRFPASRSGALGLMLDVEYSLVAYETLDGVPCALVQLRASKEGERITGATGIEFDRVLARMSGEAWIELESARVRRLVLEDEIRIALSRGRAPMIQTSRMRHATRMLFEVRDPDVVLEAWADRSTRFGPR
jgi:hypothetical protein